MSLLSASFLIPLLAAAASAGPLPDFTLERTGFKACMETLRESTFETPKVSAAVLAVSSGDELVSTRTTTDRESCTHSGYCYGCGYMPFKGKFGCGYAYHSNCSGNRTITYEVKTYRTPSGSTYTRKRETSRTSCR